LGENVVARSGGSLVQETTFGHAIEMIANFRATRFTVAEISIPPLSIAAHHLDAGGVDIFQPAP
jgi:hypothetical protein